MILSIYEREVKDEWIRLLCETGSQRRAGLEAKVVVS